MSEPKAKSIRALAAAVGRAESAVRKWLRHVDWPFGVKPPWSVSAVKRWAMTLPADKAAGGGNGDLAEAKLQLVRERTKLLRTRRLLEAGKLVNAEEVLQSNMRKIHSVKAAFLSLPRSVSAMLVGMDAAAIEAELTERIVAICQEFANGQG